MEMHSDTARDWPVLAVPPEAIDQARNALPSVAVALHAADFEKMKDAFKVPERA